MMNDQKEPTKKEKIITLLKLIEPGDIGFFLGFILIFAGFYLLCPALSLIISGTILSAISLKGVMRGDS